MGRTREITHSCRFWECIHPQWSILDPSMHTQSAVRSRSAFLYTVILAISSTALATGSDGTADDVEEAFKLQAHAEHLIVVNFVLGAKSCEIIQGHILFHVWSLAPSRYLDDHRYMRMSMCSRMALELGLHRKRRETSKGQQDQDEWRAEQLHRNHLKTRAFLSMVENRHVCGSRPSLRNTNRPGGSSCLQIRFQASSLWR